MGASSRGKGVGTVTSVQGPGMSSVGEEVAASEMLSACCEEGGLEDMSR